MLIKSMLDTTKRDMNGRRASRLLFNYSISKLGRVGILACSDSADTGGVQNYGRHADMILECSLCGKLC